MDLVNLVRGDETIAVHPSAVAGCLAIGWRHPDRSDALLTNADGTLTQVGRHFLALLARNHPGLVLEAM